MYKHIVKHIVKHCRCKTYGVSLQWAHALYVYDFCSRFFLVETIAGCVFKHQEQCFTTGNNLTIFLSKRLIT
jgi:hypothetical protein